MIFFKKAQAAVELAIFGTLILVVFGAILSYGQRFDFRQAVKMDAFRKAMRAAFYLNGAVSYSVQKDSRAVDLMSGFGQGQASSAQASTSLIWAKGTTGIQDGSAPSQFAQAHIIGADQHNKNFSIQEINNKIIDLPKYTKKVIPETGGDDDGQDVVAPVSIYQQEVRRVTDYKDTVETSETADKINSKHSAALSDKENIKLRYRFDYKTRNVKDDPNNYVPKYAYEGEHYDHAGNSGTIAAGPSVDFAANVDTAQGNKGRIVFVEGAAAPIITKSQDWQTTIK